MTEEPEPHGGEYVRSFERGLAVIRAFGPDHPKLTLSEVARETGLPRAAVRRFLFTLIELGYVRAEGSVFSLRPKIVELGYWYLATLSVTQVATPHLEELVALVNESGSVAVLDGEDITYIVRVPVPTQRIMSITIAVGTRLPAYATSIGQVLLAYLPENELEEYLEGAELVKYTANTVTNKDKLRSVLATVRDVGYALVDEELEQGLRSIAVPIHDPQGGVRTGLSISAHASRSSIESLIERLPCLRETAARISSDLSLVEGTARQR